jgi:Tfp pilus assembly protein PilF
MKKSTLMIWGITLLLHTPVNGNAQDLFDTKASETRFQSGLQLYFQKDYPEAIREFQNAVSINPDDARSYYFMGYSYYQLRDMEKAQDSFDMAYQLDPRYSPIPTTTAQE